MRRAHYGGRAAAGQVLRGRRSPPSLRGGAPRDPEQGRFRPAVSPRPFAERRGARADPPKGPLRDAGRDDPDLRGTACGQHFLCAPDFRTVARTFRAAPLRRRPRRLPVDPHPRRPRRSPRRADRGDPKYLRLRTEDLGLRTPGAYATRKVTRTPAG